MSTQEQEQEQEVIRLGALDFVLYTFLITVSYLVLKKTVQFVFGFGPSSSSADRRSGGGTRGAPRRRSSHSK